MRSEAVQAGFMLQEYDRLLAGLGDQHLALEPMPGTKTAGWLLGHLIFTGDFARKLCGLKPMAPKEWRPLFGPGTTPSREREVYPPMQALIDTFRAVYRDLVANAASATDETLALQNPYETARPAFPTSGDFAAYILTGHLGFHLGQLSIWRQAASATDPSLRR
jgi:hypothetical protein